MSPFLDRSKRADPHLEWKVRLFAVAAVLALCGIYFEERWMTGVAIGALAGAMLLRFLPRRAEDGVASEDEALATGDEAPAAGDGEEEGAGDDEERPTRD